MWCGSRGSHHCIVLVQQVIEDGINAGTTGLLALSLPLLDGSAPLLFLLLVAFGRRGCDSGCFSHDVENDGKNTLWKEV